MKGAKDAAHLLSFKSAPSKTMLYDADYIPDGHYRAYRDDSNEPTVMPTKEESVRSFFLSGMFQFVLRHDYWNKSHGTGSMVVKVHDVEASEKLILSSATDLLGATGPVSNAHPGASKSKGTPTSNDVLPKWDWVKFIVVRSTYEEFVCPICLEAPVAPRITQCGHIFCHSCLLQHLAGCKSRREKEKEKERGFRPNTSSRSPNIGGQSPQNYAGGPSPTVMLPPTTFSLNQSQNHSINHSDDSRFLHGKDVGQTKSCCPICQAFVGDETEVTTRPVAVELVAPLPTIPSNFSEKNNVTVQFQRLRRWKNSSLCLPVKMPKNNEQETEITDHDRSIAENVLLPVYGTDEARYSRVAVDDHPDVIASASSAAAFFSAQLTELLAAQEEARSDAALTESMVMAKLSASSPSPTPARHVPIGATGIVPFTGTGSKDSATSSKKTSPMHSYSKVLTSTHNSIDGDSPSVKVKHTYNFFPQEPFYARAVEIMMQLHATYNNSIGRLENTAIRSTLLRRLHYERPEWDDSSHSVELYQMADGNNVFLHSIPMVQMREEAWLQQFSDPIRSRGSSTPSSKCSSVTSTPMLQQSTPAQCEPGSFALPAQASREEHESASAPFSKVKGPHPRVYDSPDDQVAIASEKNASQNSVKRSGNLICNGAMPSTLELPVEEFTTIIQTKLTRQQYPQTAHIPLFASFTLAFVDFRRVSKDLSIHIRPSILSKFSSEYRARNRHQMCLNEKEKRYEAELEMKSRMKQRKREQMEGEHYYFHYYSKPSNGGGHFVNQTGEDWSSEKDYCTPSHRHTKRKENLLSSADYCEFEASLANQQQHESNDGSESGDGRRSWEPPAAKAAQHAAVSALSLDEVLSEKTKLMTSQSTTASKMKNEPAQESRNENVSTDDGMCEIPVNRSTKKKVGKGIKRSKKNVVAEMGFF